MFNLKIRRFPRDCNSLRAEIDAFARPREEHASGHETPLYLRATAGMRLLFPDQRESILEPWALESLLRPFQMLSNGI